MVPVAYVAVVQGYVGCAYYSAALAAGVCVTLNSGYTFIEAIFLGNSVVCIFGLMSILKYAYHHIGLTWHIRTG